MSVKSGKPWLEFLDHDNSADFRRVDDPYARCGLSRRDLIRAAAGVTGYVLASSLVPVIPGISWADNDNRSGMPPFDFSDSFYLQNGINPVNILDRVDGTVRRTTCQPVLSWTIPIQTPITGIYEFFQRPAGSTTKATFSTTTSSAWRFRILLPTTPLAKTQ